MNAFFWPCLLLFLSILSNPSQSATIIISPSGPNPTETSFPKSPSNPPSIDSTSLVQVIKDFFGCAQFGNGVCLRCENRYILDNDGRCSMVSDDCRTFNIDEGLCTFCLKGSVVVDGICYPVDHPANSLVNHCVIRSNLQCLKCQKGYFLSQGDCKPVNANFQCRNWNKQGTCLACNHGFNLITGYCIQSPKFVNCPSNQYLTASGRCQLIPANCQTWDPYNGKCVKCIAEFDFNAWKCVCSANGYCQNENCLRYNLQNKRSCDLCAQNYTLSNGKCSGKLLPENCLKWNENKTACAGCKSNYFLNALTRQCILQIQNCQKYGPVGNCIVCNQNYELIRQKCQLSVAIANCQKYDNLDRNLCSACKLGYVLEKNNCNVKSLPLNCLKWNEKFTECAQCQQKWVLNTANRQCVLSIDNCLSYGVNGECKVCAQQYELVNTKCQLIVLIPNCQKYALNNRKQCIQCQQGYEVSNNQCKQMQLPVNCLTWNKEKSGCGSCKNSFISTQRGLCSPQISNCKAYSVNGQCIRCNEKYEIVGNKCQITVVISNCIKYSPSNRSECIQCDLGFYVQKGECKERPLPKNCEKWDDKKVSCAQCKAKFILNITNGQCSEEVVNCKKYTPSGECIACINNYEIAQNTCRLKADTMITSQFYGCDTWNFTVNKCTNCFDTFDLNNKGYCFYNEDHCLERNERSFCTKCKQSYVINAGNCQVKSDVIIENKAGCKVLDWVNNNCLVCEDDFVIKENGECQKPIDNCFEQGDKGCTKCSTNFDLKNGKCESFATSRCIEMDSKGLCKRCQNSFALISGECRTFKQLGTILLDYNQFNPEKLKEKIVIFSDKPQL